MIRSSLIWLLAIPIHIYRVVISPLIASNCRFQPTCSTYALEALHRHGPLRGTRLAFCRLFRCRPGGGSGFDPVPDANKS